MAAEVKRKPAAEHISSQNGEDGNIDKIRDIIFGTNMREYDSRFARLEENINREMERMRADAQQRTDALENYIKREVESLASRLATEQASRSDSLKELTEDIGKLAGNFDKRITQTTEDSARADSDLRQQILAQSKDLGEEMQRRQNDTLASLQREADTLRNDKTDRAALADLFTEVAMRLKGEFKLPKGD
jgi:hypothetical protein